MSPDHPPLTARQAWKAIERLRPTVAVLSEVTEEVDKFGHISFRVRDRPFVIFGNGRDGEGSMAIKSDRHAQRFLIEHRGFVRTPYIGHHGWVSAPTLPPADWSEIEGLVVDAYRLAAPKSLAKRVDRHS
jgi:predicted DNA-binding protein (MmcQ/YjbR family)